MTAGRLTALLLLAAIPAASTVLLSADRRQLDQHNGPIADFAPAYAKGPQLSNPCHLGTEPLNQVVALSRRFTGFGPLTNSQRGFGPVVSFTVGRTSRPDRVTSCSGQMCSFVASHLSAES